MSEQNKTEKQVTEPVDEIEEFDGPVGGVPSYLIRMQSFLMENEVSEDEPLYYFYKYDDPETGENKRMIDRYTDGYCPDQHEIGLKHGSGRFLATVTIKPCERFPKGKFRSYRFRLHSCYDEMSAEYKRKKIVVQPAAAPESQPPQQAFYQYPPPAVPQPVSKSFDFMQLLSIAEKLIPLITPFLNRPQPRDNMQGLIKESYSVVSDLMKQTFMENFKMIQQLQQNQIEKIEDMENQQQEDKKPSLLETFAPLLGDILPKLLKDDVQSKILATAIKGAPQMKQLLDDSAQLNLIVQHLIETQGLENTIAVLDKLGIPYQMQQPPADGVEYVEETETDDETDGETVPEQQKKTA